MEDTNPSPQAPTDPSSSSSILERRPSADEESAAMTIEFLRARLLSERSVSKAARQRAQQLSKKISELEERLEAEIQLRRKLEADRVEILSKYRAELSEEYGEFFASSSGEGHSRNESQTPHEEEEELSCTRGELMDGTDSSQRLNHEDANDEDEEADLSGQEKGVLSWGRQKGSKKEFGHGTDWLGRSLSQRSVPSADGESPQKKWAGKSVRQVRKRETSNCEGEPGQSQVPEDFSDKTGQADDTKERLQCEDERDTEVERVLERQAELIEQFEAEENAQRAWEAKFKEAKALASHKTGISQSNSSSNLETMKDGTNTLVEMESANKEDSTRYSSKVHPEICQSSSGAVQRGMAQSKTIQRVAPDHASGIEFEKNKFIPSGDVEKECLPSPNQNKIGSTASGEQISEVGKSGAFVSTTKLEGPNERITEIDLPDEDAEINGAEPSCSVLKENCLQDQVLSSTKTEQTVDNAQESPVASKYKKHLSSSFRFTVFPDAEPMTSTSPQGFTTYKQEMMTVEEGEAGKEVRISGSTAALEQTSGFGHSEPRVDETHHHVATTASLTHVSLDRPRVSEDSTLSTENTESQEKPTDMLHEATCESEHSTAENGVSDHFRNHGDPISDFDREEVLKRRAWGLDGGQDLGRRHSGVVYPGVTGLGVGRQPEFGRPHLDFPYNPRSSLQHLHMASKFSEGAHFDTFNSLPGNKSRVPGPVLNVNAYEDRVLSSQRVPIDGGFDRVADVLKALQSAKSELESSGEQATPFTSDTPYTNGYDGRDAYYAAPPPRLSSVYAAPPQYTSLLPYSSELESSGEQATSFTSDTPYTNGHDGRDAYYATLPPRLPSVYAAPPQYTSLVPNASRGATPVSQNMQGWSAMQAGYGASSSRQLANAPYMHYASRVTEPQSLWPPPLPPPPPHNHHPYHYDTRPYR